MKLFKKTPMRFEGKDYEIRVLYEDTIINVVVFLDNHPVDGLRHQIMVPKKLEVKKLLERKPVQELVEISKTDITERRWQRLLQ